MWGNKGYSDCENVQNRAVRYFLGVHCFATLVGIQGDMGWDESLFRWKINALRLYNNFIAMDNNRLNKKIFLYDKNLALQHKNNWFADLYKTMVNIQMCEEINNMEIVPISVAQDKLGTYYKENWKLKIHAKPKLRTYCKIKESFDMEKYVKLNLPKHERSILAQLRLSILPLAIETGRFKNIPVGIVYVYCVI